jgi:hypothetical protein
VTEAQVTEVVTDELLLASFKTVGKAISLLVDKEEISSATELVISGSSVALRSGSLVIHRSHGLFILSLPLDKGTIAGSNRIVLNGILVLNTNVVHTGFHQTASFNSIGSG